MRSRYERLRTSIANLAAAPNAQAAHLDEIFAELAGGRSAEGYGNKELVDEFDDLWCVIDLMVEEGEVSPSERDAIKPLSKMLDRHCADADQNIWLRQALYSDARWERLRQCARQVLTALPDRHCNNNL